mgnify:CR=1 FL=1
MMDSTHIETTLRNKGFERGTKSLIQSIAEEMRDIRRTNKDLMEMMLKMAQVMELQDIAMIGQQDKLKQYERNDDQSNTSTRELLDGPK